MAVLRVERLNAPEFVSYNAADVDSGGMGGIILEQVRSPPKKMVFVCESGYL